MEHIIKYLIVNNRDNIKAAVEKCVMETCDIEEDIVGRHCGDIVIENGFAYDCYDNAKAFLDTEPKGCTRAVMFFDIDASEIKRINKKIKSLASKRQKYIDTHSITKRKTAKIKCRNCDSVLTRRFLTTENCPVCYADLRKEYELDKIREFTEKENMLKEERAIIKEKLENKAKIKYLVKVDIHKD